MDRAVRERRTPRRTFSIVATLGLVAGMLALLPSANAGVTKCQAQNVTLGTKASPNLQGLINAANPGNTIQVKGVCVGPFTIAKNLTLFGKPTKDVPHPTLDGGFNATTKPSPGPVVRAGAGTSVTIRDLTIQHGAYPCTETNQTLECDTGGIFNAGALTLTRVTVGDNIGSGIGNYPVDGAASLSLTDSTVTRNHAQFHGGGVFTGSGAVTLTRTTVTDNDADFDAGGISVAFGAGSVTLNDSEVSHNTAGDQGGGIWNGADLILNGSSTVDHNTATTDGGGVFNFKGAQGQFTFDGDLVLNDTSEVSDNSAGGNGGGVHNTGAVTLNDDSSVHDNAADTGTGGGIFNDCASGLLTGVTEDKVYDNTPDDVNSCNRAPVAVSDAYTTDEDTTLIVAATAGVLGNDTDPDAADTLSVTTVNGSASNVGTQFTLFSGALLTVNADGSLTYNPNGAFDYLGDGNTAQDTFTYGVSDGHGGFSAGVAVINIVGLNDAPVPVNE